jgi:membrane protein insertase Oxa1/YidC/SpoIIIJ
VAQGLLRFTGVNIYPVDPRMSRMQNLKHMEFEIEDIKRRKTMLLRDRNNTADDRQKINEEYNDLIKERMRQRMEYAKASVVHPRLQ